MWSSEFSPPHPPVSDSLVREVEALLGVTLPESYVALMRQKNGGYIGEQLVPVEGDVPEDMDHYVDHGCVSVGSIAGLNPDPDAANSVSRTGYMTREWDLPEGLVLLDGDGHTWVALDYRQRPDDPPVIFIESDSGQHVTLAPDFARFLESMVPYDEVFDEDGELREGQ